MTPLRWIALSAMLAGSAAGQPAAAVVNGVRFWSLDQVTRVAIEVSGEFQYKFDRLPNPERLFFDIRSTRPWERGVKTIPVNDGILKQIRVAESQSGVTRVVLDLAGKTEFTASQLANPHRLMVELKPQDPRPALRPEKTADPVTEVSRAEPAKAEAVKTPAVTARASPAADTPETVETAPKPVAPPAAPKPELAGPVPKSAKPNANGGRSMTRVLGLKVTKIVIDPGHGGHDVGTISPGGLYEKDLVLDVSKRVAALLEERLGAEVVLTRNEDIYVALEERTRIANQHKADLFLSIHANSSPVRSVAGVETYHLNFTTNRNALEVAARENAGSSKSVGDLKDLLQKIALRDKADESEEFAARLQRALHGFSARNNAAARNRGVKRAPFVVLIGASMPSVLAEIGFLTNSTDEALLKRGDYRQKLAEALAQGVASYAESLSRFQVASRE
jgi:N-acetylmuramoyl-L-alanine amidase